MPTITKHIHINAPIDKVYAFWENFENFPSHMEHIESVKKLDNDHYILTVKGPLNNKLEIKSEVLERKPNESIKWASKHETKEGTADAKGRGEIHFKKADSGASTDVDLHLNIEMSGQLAEKMKEHGKSADFPAEKIERNLQKIKEKLEHEAR